MAYIFNTYPNWNYVGNHGFFGQAGWFSLPLNWYCKTDTNGVIWASPNSDFSQPVYECKLDLDGTLVLQDLMYQKQISPPQNLKI